VWSLAVILFQMLTQDYPFVAETLPQLLVMVLETEPVRLRARLPLAPEGLEQVLVRALEKDRELRYPTVTDFALALAPYGTEASRVSLTSIESALPAREGASSPTLPAPASAPNASVTEETQAASRTIPMWPDRASTLEPVDTSLGGSSPGASAAGPGGRKVLLASLVIGLASLVVIAAVSLTRGPTSAHPSGGASALAGPELGAGAPRSATRPPDEPVPAPSTRPPEGQASPSGNDATLGTAAVAPDAASSTARTTKTKPPGSPAPPSASEKPKPAASVPSVAASPQPPPPPNCTPPYKLDGNGKHVPKPECL
jgi:serine/threonine-protein kinase